LDRRSSLFEARQLGDFTIHNVVLNKIFDQIFLLVNKVIGGGHNQTSRLRG
jgi:hypothetical protein